MAIYEIAKDKIVPFEKTSFETVNLKEREDLQRLLKSQIDVVCPDSDVLVISEGFRDWEGSNREIDLLAIDKDANLVVIELKRTNNAGHAELQAIRYAAMVSEMTFDKAVDVYSDHLRKTNGEGDAAEGLLEFLGWGEPDEDHFAQDVRIVLVSADFSKELTTSVMWLNERDLDIRCVRMRPYRDGGRVLVDVQQVIPLPEAQEYTVRIREKKVKERLERAEQRDTKTLRLAFWGSHLERSASKTNLFAGVSACDDVWITTGRGISGVHYTYLVTRHTSLVRFALEANNKPLNKARYDRLLEQREEIERAFGGPLKWERRDDIQKSQMSLEFEGGYQNDQTEWTAIHDRMIDAMTRLHRAISPLVPELRHVLPTEDLVGEGE